MRRRGVKKTKAGKESSGAIVLAGAGHMGGALAAGWCRAGLAKRLAVVEPAPSAALKALQRKYKFRLTGDAAKLPRKAAAVVLAVKPQTMAEAAPAYTEFAARGALTISIAAGVPLKRLAEYLGREAAIVRVMPNLPAAIGQGAAVAVPNARVSARQRRLAVRLLAATGEVIWSKEEALLDAATATSGSGPAYVFLLAEALAAAGSASGLPAEMAARLARQTVTGAAALMAAAKESAAELRKAVMSPGGTTEAALRVLMGENGLQDLLTQAVAAAAKRARELGW